MMTEFYLKIKNKFYKIYFTYFPFYILGILHLPITNILCGIYIPYLTKYVNFIYIPYVSKYIK